MMLSRLSSTPASTRTRSALRFRHHHHVYRNVLLRSLTTTTTTVNLPERANVVVVGGGIIGTSVAYHLAKFGVEDVLLLERDRLTSGTTWHAAGLMNTFGTMSPTSLWMRQYTRQLYSEILPQETGLETGWMQTGFVELACDEDRLYAYRRCQNLFHLCSSPGIHNMNENGTNHDRDVVQEISPKEVQERFPLCNVDHVLAGFWVPGDGRANPTDATLALAKGARLRGVTILEQCPVKGVLTTSSSKSLLLGGCWARRPSVTGVVLRNGHEIEAKVVVNCAGMWARQLGQDCGVSTGIPNQAAEHYYLLTEPIPNVDENFSKWPIIEDASRCVYIRPEGQGLLLGFFEREGAAPWMASEGVPEDFSFGQLEPDWDRLGPYVESAILELVPALQNVGIKSLFCGPESFTPDGCPIVGESMELENYYVAAGLNSLGILTAGGIGHILARWIQRKGVAPPDVDVTDINILRFHGYQSNPDYRKQRVGETLGNTYRVHYPDHQPQTCRNVKQSPLHERLAVANAYFRDVSGWESPAWYAPAGVDAVVERESFGREPWFQYWESEHLNCRENVALFDMSFMSKFLVQGPGAGAFLNRLSTANVDQDCGRVTYTQWLNEDGYMEADLTVSKLGEGQFLVVATDTMHNQVHHHMLRRLPGASHSATVVVTDVTGRYAQINIQGPRSRDLLQTLTSVDLSNSAFAFRNVEDIDIGLARVICARMTYVGELGYELFIPVEQARLVYDRIVDVGSRFGLQHAGLKALGSLRLEKGYRDYGHDMDNTDTLLECGLGFTCDFEKAEPFIGQSHVLQQKQTVKAQGGLMRRLVQVLLNKDSSLYLLHAGEVLRRNGRRVCEIRSASYGHTLGGAVGLAMLETAEHDEPITTQYVADGDWEVEIADKVCKCKVSLTPLYDPKNLRVKV